MTRAEPTAGKANQRTVTETRRSTRRITRRSTLQRKSCSQPDPKHPRTDANVQQGQQGQKELKLDERVAKISEIIPGISAAKDCHDEQKDTTEKARGLHDEVQ